MALMCRWQRLNLNCSRRLRQNSAVWSAALCERMDDMEANGFSPLEMYRGYRHVNCYQYPCQRGSLIAKTKRSDCLTGDRGEQLLSTQCY